MTTAPLSLFSCNHGHCFGWLGPYSRKTDAVPHKTAHKTFLPPFLPPYLPACLAPHPYYMCVFSAGQIHWGHRESFSGHSNLLPSLWAFCRFWNTKNIRHLQISKRKEWESRNNFTAYECRMFPCAGFTDAQCISQVVCVFLMCVKLNRCAYHCKYLTIYHRYLEKEG